MLDDDIVQLIRCNGCLFYLSRILILIGVLVECKANNDAAGIANMVSDVVFCCVGGYMTAQVNHEMNIRDKGSSSKQYCMQSY